MTDRSLEELEAENHALREQLRRCREYDSLTGLLSKDAFFEQGRALLSERQDTSYDLACVDVERFKLINHVYGSAAGDRLLRYTARELRKAFPPPAHLTARLGNDVFALLLPSRLREEAQQAVLRIFRDNPLGVMVTPAMGFCPVTDRTQPISALCDRASLALERTKGNYFQHAAVFDSGQMEQLLDEHTLLHDVEAALERREFEVYFQPKCNMLTEKVVGAEALARWRHPTRGLIPPSTFIPLFERNGFIKQLDLYIWEETARRLRRWIDMGHRPLPVSVNISRTDILTMDVCAALEEILRRYRLEPSLLELEITESTYVNQPEAVIRTVERLMRRKFTILMDDFGSGYSSLNMLNNVNVDILKLDMRFLEHNGQKSKDILESVVHMSKWLDLPLIAEGVEYQWQVDFLKELGCVYAQGFFFYRPMPAEDYEALLLDGRAVDFSDDGTLRIDQKMLLDFHDLFHKDVMSDRLLGNVLGAIALCSFDGRRLRLLRGTEAYYRLTGRSDAFENLPAGAQDLFSDVQEEDRPLLLDALERARQSQDERGAEVCLRQCRPGAARWLKLQFFHLARKNGEDIFYGALSDVTEQMEYLEHLQISEERFRVAMEATNILLFELDIATREARYSEYAQRTFSLDATVANAPEGFIEQDTVCPESQADFRWVYDAIYRGEPRASSIIHAKLKDGVLIWNRITLTAIKDRAGQTVKAVGIVETVSRSAEPSPEIQAELEQQAMRRKGGSLSPCTTVN
ncbi:EAL domain-containing protein [Pseudoflavonifractor phocaeensis]|uniref:EAL domain-containing protein n=1 Tax=Pseudoflavonifractor phocaeensis TaxID=1870988 RepID=UPI00313C70D9